MEDLSDYDEINCSWSSCNSLSDDEIGKSLEELDEEKIGPEHKKI